MMKFYSYFTPNLKESWILTFYLIVIGGIVSGVIVLLLNLIFPESSIVTNIIGYILTFLPALLVIRRKSKIKEADYKIDDNKKPIIKLNGSNFGKINPILFFFLLLLSIPAINIILDPFTEFLKSPEWFNKIMEQAVGGNFIVSIISVAILAPLLEEFFCRGIIMRGLLHHTTATKAILWSAFIFAVIHLNPWQGIPAFISGIFFGWIYYKTGSLWATIFLHFVNNFLASLSFKLFPEIPMGASIYSVINDTQLYCMIFAVAVGILTLIIFFLNKYISANDKETISA